MAYATVADVQERLAWTMSEDQENICSVLLDDAAVLIDAAALNASDEAKKVVSCRMVIRALGDGGDAGGVPMGATQGSMSALGYSQSWTIGSGGATVEDVALMKKAAGANVKVKASGGIRDYATAKAMIEAGADRIGASAGVSIVKEEQEAVK